MVECSRCHLIRDGTTKMNKLFVYTLPSCHASLLPSRSLQTESFSYNTFPSPPPRQHLSLLNTVSSIYIRFPKPHQSDNMSVPGTYHPLSMYTDLTIDTNDCWFMPICHEQTTRPDLLGDHFWSCGCAAEAPGQANSTQPCHRHPHWRKWLCGHRGSSRYPERWYYCRSCAARLLTLQIGIQTWPSNNAIPSVTDPIAASHLILEFQGIYGWYDQNFWLEDYWRNKNLLNPNL